MPFLRARSALLTIVAVLAAAAAAPAGAAVGPAVTIDGPAPEIGPLGGVAFASDGTGGVVYQRAVDGRQHVFAAAFDGHRWSPPQRVDTAVPYDAFAPRIGAATGGRLVAVWAQHVAAGVDALQSATLARGGGHFQAPTIIDDNIGTASAAAPTVAMNDAGAALVAYRAIRDLTGAGLPAGTVSGEIRVARYDRTRWQKLGVPANRNRATPLAAPSADTAPALGIDDTGNGEIAWAEPDDGFVGRVWARRIFGTRFGVAQAVSPLGLRGAADRPALAENGLGRVVAAYRQLPDPRDRTAGPRLFVSELGDLALKFADPVAVGDGGDATASLGTDRAGFVLGLPSGGLSQLAFAPKLPGPAAVRAEDPTVSAPGPVVSAGRDGRSVLATAGEAGGGEVAIRELEGTDVLERRPVSAAGGGPIRELAAAGTGLGDALVAFGQGVDGDRQVAVSLVDTAPSSFALTLPENWSRQRSPEVSWTPAVDVLGPVVYTVSIDGRRVGRTRATALRLREGVLDQGTHVVRVVATDPQGQQTPADPADYRLDRQAPVAAVAVRGRRVTLRLTDPGGVRRASGVGKGVSSVTWGDGRSTEDFTRSATHRFRRGGRFTLSISSADAAGNRLVVKRVVRVR